MARYWVGGTGNWNDTAHWSDSDGGSGGFSVPTSADDVYFTANSGTGTCTINAAASCKNFDASASSLLTIAGSSYDLSVYGTFALKTGMTWNHSRTIYFKATSGPNNITTAGVEIKAAITFDGVGGSWSLVDALYMPTKSITITNGAFDANEQTIDLIRFTYYGSATRSLDISNCTIYLYGSSMGSTSGFTFTSTGSTIHAKGASCGWWVAQTFNDIIIDNTCSSWSFSTSSPTVHDLTINPHTSKMVTLFQMGYGLTITGTLTANGNENHRIAFEFVWGGNATLTAAAVSLSYIDFWGINGAGAAAPFTGTSIGLGYGGTNITEDTPRTLYWVGDGGNYSDSAHWSLSSGGTGGEAPPLVQDTVIFDGNSFTTGSQTVVLDRHIFGKDFDAHLVTNSPSFTIAAYTDYCDSQYGLPKLYGNVNFGGFSFNLVSDSRVELKGFAASTAYDLYGHTGTGNLPAITIDVIPSGTTYNQRSAITLQRFFSWSSGITYNSNNYAITLNNLSGTSFSLGSSNSGNHINLGTSVITINSDFANYGGNMPVDGVWTGNWTLIYNCPSYTNAVFTPDIYSSGFVIPNLVVNGEVSFSSVSATYGITNITIEAGKRLRLKNGYTCNITSLVSNGTSGSEAKLESTTAGSAATISKASGSVRPSEIAIKDSAATGGASFRAIASTSVSGNSGWVFISENSSTVQAKANIKGSAIATVSAKADILNTVTATVQAKALIVLRSTVTVTAKARIKQEAVETSIEAKARIKSSGTLQSIQAKARIVLNTNVGRKLRVKYGFDNEFVNHIVGYTEIPKVERKRRTASFHFYDELEKISDFKLPGGSLYTDIRTDLYIWDILDEVYADYFTTIEHCDSDWTDADHETTGHREGTACVKVTSTAGTEQTGYKAIALDLSGYTDDDHIDFFLYVEDVTKIEELKLRLWFQYPGAFYEYLLNPDDLVDGWNEIRTRRGDWVASYTTSGLFTIGVSEIGGTDELPSVAPDWTDMDRIEMIVNGTGTDTVYAMLDEIRIVNHYFYPRRYFDIGLQVIPVAWFAGNTALYEIKVACESEGARFYADEEGAIRFENRQHYNVNAEHKQSVHEFNYDNMTDFEYENKSQLINKVIVRMNPRRIVAEKDIWQYATVPAIGAGQTRTIWAEFTDPCPVTVSGIVTPVATTDYTANTQEDGGGTDKTAQISIVITKFSNSAKLEVTNNDAGTVYLTLLKVRGTPAEEGDPITVTVQDDVSIGKYGVNPTGGYKIENKYLADETYAGSLAQQIIDWYSDISKRVLLNGRSVPYLQIGDLITVKNEDLNVSHLMRILGIKTSFDNKRLNQDITARAITFFETLNYFEVGVSAIGGTDVISP